MAHANIDERRAYVKQLLDQGAQITPRLKTELAQRFRCSSGAIHTDIKVLQGAQKNYYTGRSLFWKGRIYERDGYECQYCGIRGYREWVVEHVVPRALGGPSEPYNLVIACASCNRYKEQSVWIPRNLDKITQGYPEWRQRVIEQATPAPKGWRKRVVAQVE